MSLIKVLVVFLIIIFLITRRLNLGLIMLAGAFLLALLFAVWPWEWLQIAFYSAIDYTTVSLILSLVLIQFLEATLRRSGMLEQMVSSLKKLVPEHRLVMAFLPAFLGFLPSAGGALFSAPLVEEASKGYDISPSRKAFINFWFRHIWECIFPLYPGLILASSLLGVRLSSLVLHQWHYTVSAIIVGSVFAFPKIKSKNGLNPERGTLKDLGKLFFTILPVAVILVLVLIFHIELVLALVSVLLLLWAWVAYSLKYKFSNFWDLVKKAFSINTVFLVLGVIVFKDTMIQSGSVKELSDFFFSSGVPSILLVSFLPFFVGLLTGVTQAFVGVSFPLLLGIFGNPINLNMVALAYISGFVGVLASPVHLCLVLTRQYFKADWGKIYSMLAPSSALVLGVAFLVYILF